MILAALLLLAQTVPAPAPAQQEEVEEVVIQATFGTTTMLFDKGADNKLRNCRIMVSSGSQRRDTAACQATPVCYEKTAAQVTECTALVAIEPAFTNRAAGGAPGVFDMPRLVQPKAAPSTAVAGPAEAGENRETERQRVKLPPLPKSPTSGPVVRITNAQDK